MRGSARFALVNATKELLAEDGYTATSPRDILNRSGAGQGALYHHFQGKNDLVCAALQETSAEMRDEIDTSFIAAADPLQAVLAWLTAPRQALKGCRLGRLTGESLVDDAQLRQPLATYFHHAQARLAQALRAAVDEGQLHPDTEPDDLATAIVAVVQGGYVISRATGDENAMNRAQRAAASLLATTGAS